MTHKKLLIISLLLIGVGVGIYFYTMHNKELEMDKNKIYNENLIFYTNSEVEVPMKVKTYDDLKIKIPSDFIKLTKRATNKIFIGDDIPTETYTNSDNSINVGLMFTEQKIFDDDPKTFVEFNKAYLESRKIEVDIYETKIDDKKIWNLDYKYGEYHYSYVLFACNGKYTGLIFAIKNNIYSDWSRVENSIKNSLVFY